ncbi:GNAT family N-acetyltransferase [Halobium palmae]|uniref:GNAT family N-acetyltransferase n=1 Tax=Halobium palmae TaxID=1776492 RepID=A0ABD5RYV5_9EURY
MCDPDDALRTPAGSAPPSDEGRDGIELGDGATAAIREYRPTDRASLTTMYVEFPAQQREMGLPPLGGRDRVASWLDRILERGRNVVATVAGHAEFDDGSVVGHAVVSPTMESTPELAVFVRPAFQNRGVGTRLCATIVELARVNGHDGIMLRVAESNRRAVRVYEKLGFEVTEDPSEKPWQEMRLTFDRPGSEVG